MGLEKVILKSYTKSIRSNLHFKTLISDLKGQLPNITKFGDLKGVILQKNNISKALSEGSGVLNNLGSMKSSVSTVINTLSSTTKIIKSLPIPTSSPPGVGIPIGIITTYADSLDGIREFLKENKGQLKSITPVIKGIKDLINDTRSELNSLDRIIMSKIDNEVDSHIDMEIGNELRLDGILPQMGGNNINYNTLKEEMKSSQKYIQRKIEIKSQILEDLGVLKSFNEKPQQSKLNILNSLSINSQSPLIYKNFRLIIQSKPNNPYSQPFRRIRGKNLTTNVVIYNSEGDYSFSSSIEVLLGEIKYEIDKIS